MYPPSVFKGLIVPDGSIRSRVKLVRSSGSIGSVDTISSRVKIVKIVQGSISSRVQIVQEFKSLNVQGCNYFKDCLP